MFAAAFGCLWVCGFAGFAGAGLAAVAGFAAATAGLTAAALVAVFTLDVWAAFTTGCAGVLASGFKGFAEAVGGTAVFCTACCKGVAVVPAVAAFVIGVPGAGTPAMAFGSHPGMLAACPFGAFFFFLNNDPMLEIVFAALETVEATWPPAFPAAAHGFDMALPIPPCAYDEACPNAAPGENPGETDADQFLSP